MGLSRSEHQHGRLGGWPSRDDGGGQTGAGVGAGLQGKVGPAEPMYSSESQSFGIPHRAGQAVMFSFNKHRNQEWPRF